MATRAVSCHTALFWLRLFVPDCLPTLWSSYDLGSWSLSACPMHLLAECPSSLRASDEPPFVILLDLEMPVMNGWELRTELAADAALADIQW